MVRKTSREGFTLIELSLAMVFISLLSLAIVLIIMNTISSYRRGVTLSAVNTTGSQIVDDFRVAIQNGTASSIEKLCSVQYSNSKADESTVKKCVDDGAKNFVSITFSGKVKLPGDSTEKTKVPLYGALCTGTYSYIWNSGYFFVEGATVTTSGSLWKDSDVFTGGNAEKKWFSGNKTPVGSARVWYRNEKNKLVDVAGFRLLKILDESREICTSKSKGGSASAYDPYRTNSDMKANVFDITYNKSMVVVEEPADLLAAGDTNDLALYSLEIDAPAEDMNGSNLFYAGAFILGTTTGGPDVKTSGKTCAAPGDATMSNFDYCAINRFSFAAQANGG